MSETTVVSGDQGAAIPERLAGLLDYYGSLTDRSERVQALIDLAGTYREVPVEVARRPFAESYRVPACESEAFVFAVPTNDGHLALHFAVENPQGLSAMALAALLAKTLSGLPAAQLVNLPGDLILTLFGRELSMGKSMGLMSMVGMVRNAARKVVASAELSAGPAAEPVNGTASAPAQTSSER